MVILVAPCATAGVILNTLGGYEDKAPGWYGSLNGIFSGSGGNTERILLEAGGKVQWNLDQDRWRLQASGGYEESGGQQTARNLVIHLRQNHDLSPAWATVAFAQVQHNPFQRLQSRWLFGAGVRHDLRDDDWGQVVIGATPMLEIERLEGEEGHVERGRMSIFIHVSRKLSEVTRLDLTAFWQPLFTEVANSRTVLNLALSVDLTGAVDLKIGAAVEDNARPPAGVERTDWSTYVGLGYDF